MLGSFQVLDAGEPRRRPDGTALYGAASFPRAEVEIVAGSWDVVGLRGHRQLRLDGRGCLLAGAADHGPRRRTAR